MGICGWCLVNPASMIVGKEVTDQFRDLVRIGEGTYGVVFRARHIKSGVMFAIKETKQDIHEEGVQSSALREISLMYELDHPNVLKLYDVLSDRYSCKVWMVMEYLDMDLWRMVQKHPMLLPSHPELVKFYMWQLLQGLEYTHSRRVIHRDIKPQNLLIHLKKNQIKFCDFGLARAMGMPFRGLSPEVVTIWYRAPELLLSSRTYSAAVDMWSMGCIFYEMTTSKPLFPGMTDIDQLGRIFKVLGIPNERSWPGFSELPGIHNVHHLPQLQPPQDMLTRLLQGSKMCKDGLDLLTSLLAPDPSQRPSARMSLLHPYFNDIANILKAPPILV